MCHTLVRISPSCKPITPDLNADEHLQQCRYLLWQEILPPGRVTCRLGTLEMPSLIHLIYASVATEVFGSVELSALLEQSREANKRLGLTGMLLFSDNSFFQVLEGEPAAVDQLYVKIAADKRHAQTTLIIREPITKRSFENWSMGFANVSQEELRNIEGMNDFFHTNSCFVRLDAGRAKKLLAAFGEGCWRGNHPSKAKRVAV
jgi:hypothetical protein